MKLHSLLFIVLLAFGLASCGREYAEEPCAFVPNTAHISVDLQWQSLEGVLPAISTKAELVQFFSANPVIRDAVFNRTAYPDDSVFINQLYQRFTNPHIDTLLMETQKVFGDGAALKKQFEAAFANLKYYYPDFELPTIQTVITGLETDLYVTDTLVVIGLDHYLGPGAKYQPNMYEYMKRRYHKDFIVPSVMLLLGIDARFNRIDPTDRTMLADMVAYGKAYHFAKLMTPCLPDSMLIGYTAQETYGSRKNEHLIWSRLVEDEVLYSTSAVTKQKYIIERPKTLEVGEKCPGRIGQWVGWQIVKTYHNNHPDLSLPQVMALPNASELFRQSGYKPQVVKLTGKNNF